MKAIARLLLASALAVSWQLTPPVAPPVAAACSSGSCASLTIYFDNSNGAGYISTFPSGLDCERINSGTIGPACTAQYDAGAGGTTVTVYVDPGVKTYACDFSGSCGGIEQRITRTVTLFPGDSEIVGVHLYLASKTTVSLSSSGTGSGRTQSEPAGLDCRWDGQVESGTCVADYWYIGSSTTITLWYVPNPGSFACRDINNCGVPDAPYTAGISLSPGASGPPARYYLVKPVQVQVTGPGSIVSSPSGIACPPTCSKWFKPATTVTLTAIPGTGANLTDWSSDCDAVPTFDTSCQLSLQYFGATVGATFLGPATAPPTLAPTAKPTAKPTTRPTFAPTAGPTTRPSIAPTSRPPASAPSSGPGTTLPTSTIAPTPVTGAPDPSDEVGPMTTVGPGSLPQPGAPSPPGAVAVVDPTAGRGAGLGPVGAPQAAVAGDSMLLLLVVVLAVVLGLVLGGIVMYALLRTRRRTLE